MANGNVSIGLFILIYSLLVGIGNKLWMPHRWRRIQPLSPENLFTDPVAWRAFAWRVFKIPQLFVLEAELLLCIVFAGVVAIFTTPIPREADAPLWKMEWIAIFVGFALLSVFVDILALVHVHQLIRKRSVLWQQYLSKGIPGSNMHASLPQS